MGRRRSRMDTHASTQRTISKGRNYQQKTQTPSKEWCPWSMSTLRGCTHVMHGRSRMTIDPRIPTMPGRSTSGFHRPGRHCLHQARNAVRCWASRMKVALSIFFSRREASEAVKGFSPRRCLAINSYRRVRFPVSISSTANYLIYPLSDPSRSEVGHAYRGSMPVL